MRKHVVKQGETIIGLAQQWDLLPKTLWDANDALKAKRKNMNVLLPGDVLLVPEEEEFEKEKHVESGGTEQHHRFVLEPIRGEYRLQVFRGEKPFAQRKYELEVAGQIVSDKDAKTDANGLVKHDISVLAPNASVRFPLYGEEISANLGHLDPVDEDSGWRQRLEQLGYPCGRDDDGELGATTQQALARFQYRFSEDKGLKVTGEADTKTQKALEDFFAEVRDFPKLPKPTLKPIPPFAPPGPSIKASAAYARLKVTKVLFENNADFTMLDPYETCEWRDGRDFKSPLYFLEKEVMNVRVQLRVEVAPPIPQRVVIVGTASDPKLTFRAVTVIEPGATVVEIRAEASAGVPATVGEKMTVEWTTNAQGEGPQKAGTTEHPWAAQVSDDDVEKYVQEVLYKTTVKNQSLWKAGRCFDSSKALLGKQMGDNNTISPPKGPDGKDWTGIRGASNGDYKKAGFPQMDAHYWIELPSGNRCDPTLRDNLQVSLETVIKAAKRSRGESDALSPEEQKELEKQLPPANANGVQAKTVLSRADHDKYLSLFPRSTGAR
jgi:hypothetical protein